MKQILLLILLTASNDVLAQERIDTLYYNRSGSVVPSPAFAEYYRIALYPADSAGSKILYFGRITDRRAFSDNRYAR